MLEIAVEMAVQGGKRDDAAMMVAMVVMKLPTLPEQVAAPIRAERFQSPGEKEGWRTFIPAFEYCTDNAAMIAITGYFKFLEKDFTELGVSPSARAEW